MIFPSSASNKHIAICIVRDLVRIVCFHRRVMCNVAFSPLGATKKRLPSESGARSQHCAYHSAYDRIVL